MQGLNKQMILKDLANKFWNKLKKYEYKKMYCLEISLNEIKAETADNKYIFRKATLTDLKFVINERGDVFFQRYKRWLNNGYCCYILLKNDYIIGFIWLIKSSKVPVEFGYYHKIKTKQEASLIDSYIRKRERNLISYSILTNHVIKKAYEIGIRKLNIYILENNKISLITHYYLGFKKVKCILYHFKFLFIKAHYWAHNRNFKDLSNYENFKLINYLNIRR